MISVIVPVYNEEESLEVLHRELRETLGPLGRNYEIICVDDGSRDNSLGVLGNIVQQDVHVKIVQLARHYGQTEAMQAGIDYAKGDIIIFIDADLQNDPRDIPRLLAKMDQGYDMVSGWRKNRKDLLFSKKLPSFVANCLISQFSKVRLHDYGCSLKAYRRDVIKQIRLYAEMHRFIPIYASRLGASICEIEVSHRKRMTGKSKYNLMRIPRVVLDFFVAEFINNYLNKPMYIFGTSGLFSLFLGAATGAFIIIRKVFFGGVWISPLLFIMVLLIIIGFQFVLMGFLAEISIRLYYKSGGELTYAVKLIIDREKGNEKA